MAESPPRNLKIAFQAKPDQNSGSNSTHPFDGAYVIGINLEEKLSAPYKLEVEILLESAVARKSLKDVLGSKARVEIWSKIIKNEPTERYAVRYVCGLVSKLRCCGVIQGESENGRSKCWRYLLTIEPPLVLLGKTRSTRTFEQKTPPAVIETILKNYGILISESKDITKAGVYDGNLIFQQQEESDLAFIYRLMRLYGLNFNFVHKKDGFDPEIFLTNGWVFEWGTDEGAGEGQINDSQKVEYYDADRSKISVKKSSLLLTAATSDSSKDKDVVLKSWYCEEGLTTEVISVGEDSSDYDKEENRQISWLRANDFNLSTDAFGQQLNATDKKTTVDFVEAMVKRGASVWRGHTDSIAVSPGIRLQIKDFFDLQTSSENSGDNLDVLVVSAELSACEAWPTSLACPSGENWSEKSIDISIEAVEANNDDEDKCGSFAASPAVVEAGSPAGGSLGAPLTDDAKPFGLYCGEVVAAKDGNVFDAYTDAELPTRIRVKLASSNTPVSAEVIMPIGGAGDGLFSLPRAGDRVLVACYGGNWYLSGYLPQSIVRVAQKSWQEYRIGKDSWRQIAKASDMGTWSEYAANEISLREKGDKVAYMLDIIFANGLERFAQMRTALTGDKAYYEAYAQIKETWGPVTKYLNAFIQAQDEYLREQNQEKETVLALAWNLLYKLAEDCAGKLMDAGRPDQAVATLQTQGDMGLYAGPRGELTLGGPVVSLNGNKVTLSGKSRIEIDSETSIKLKVGKNSITIDTNGISIRSLKGKTAGGVLDSVIKLDSYSGVAINGLTCKMNGVLRASLADSLGGVVSSDLGSVMIGGNDVRLRTTHFYNAMKKVLLFVNKALIECPGQSQELHSSLSNMWTGISSYDTLLDSMQRLTCDWTAYSQADKGDFWSNLSFALKMVEATIDLTVNGMVATGQPFLTQKTALGTGKDLLLLLAMVTKLGLVIAHTVQICKTMLPGGLGTTCLILTNKEVSVKGKQIDFLAGNTIESRVNPALTIISNVANLAEG